MKAERISSFVLTLFVVAISGNPAMSVLGKESLYVGTFLVFFIGWCTTSFRLARQDALVFTLFGILTLVHVVTFGTMAVPASLGFLLKLGIALLAIRIIPEFPRHYISVMYALSLISLIFWIPLALGADLQNLLSDFRVPITAVDDNFHIGIHNLRQEYDGSIRNMGMFWEPGAFAGYLILALFFLVRDGHGQRILSKTGMVLIAALLSTQSTTGYLALMTLVALFASKAGLIGNRATRLWIFALLIIVAASSLGVFGRVSFLGEKIERQLDAVIIGDDASRINRFGNMFYDLGWISERPIFGWSANPDTRALVDPEVSDLAAGQGNGLTGFAVRFGLTGLLIFLAFSFQSTKRMTGSVTDALFGIAVVTILLIGEQFLSFPIFLTLMFVPRRDAALCREVH